MEVCLASHLKGQKCIQDAEPLLQALQTGGGLLPHLSPMKSAKTAFKRATSNGDWSRYVRLMDQILNKWGIYHFHLSGGGTLLFVHLCRQTATARVIDSQKHSDGWCLERRLIKIIIEEWPDAEIVRVVGYGLSELSEEDHLVARRRGLNMPVEVNGTFYLPANRALMTDGSGYDLLDGPIPICIFGKMFNEEEIASSVGSPQMLAIGVEPDSMLPPWVVAAGEAGRLSLRRHELMMRANSARIISEAVQHTVRQKLWRS